MSDILTIADLMRSCAEAATEGNAVDVKVEPHSEEHRLDDEGFYLVLGIDSDDEDLTGQYRFDREGTRVPDDLVTA